MIFLKSHFFGTKEKPYFHWEIRLWWKVIIEKLGRVHYTFWILFGSYITCVTDHLQRNAMKHYLNDVSKVRMFWKAEIKLFKSHSLGSLWKCHFHHDKFRWTWTFYAVGGSSPNLYWNHAHFWVFVIAIKTTKPCRSGHRNRENGSSLPLDSHRSKGFHPGFHRSGPQWRQDPVWPSLS